MTTGRRCLFVFAHPDDDAFIAGTMCVRLAQGASVDALWLTSGDRFGSGTRREQELGRAMDVIGLGCSHRLLLRLPDLGLIERLDQASDSVAGILDQLRPETIFVTAFEGGHPDHDAANFIAYEAARRARISPEMFEFPLYNGTGRVLHWRWRINRFPESQFPVLHTPLPDEIIFRKYQAMRAYTSQWMFMAPLRLVSSRARMRHPGEPYRLIPEDRNHALPHWTGRPNYERWFNRFMNIGFQDFCRAVVSARSAPRND